MELDRNALPENMRLYPLKEVAAILGVTVRSVHRYMRDGRLDAKKLGGQWRISQSAINTFLEQGKTLSDCLSEERQIKKEGA